MDSSADRGAVTLVAHRGYPQRYPENTRVGLEAAVAVGAEWLEIDVQLTADHQPILFHDAELQRVCGAQGTLLATPSSQLEQLRASFPERFGQQFADERLLWLTEFATLLQRSPEVQAFVEIKGESAAAFGAAEVVRIVVDALQPVLSQCVIISMDLQTLVAAQQAVDRPLGWVLPDWDAASESRARALAPQYLFASARRLLPLNLPLWDGPWTWVAYTVDAWQQAAALAARGIQYVETDSIGELLASQSS